jgi:hypothetical protein
MVPLVAVTAATPTFSAVPPTAEHLSMVGHEIAERSEILLGTFWRPQETPPFAVR